jgi:NADPH-dependent glutamate synthase beta subunit-like oxidoreductase
VPSGESRAGYVRVRYCRGRYQFAGMKHHSGGGGKMKNGDRPITIITGGSRGIGAATAVQLAQAGHDLILAYRNDDSAARATAAQAQAPSLPSCREAPAPQ